MIEKIAMWGGVAAIVISLFAIIILYLTRSNIIDLLDRDVVMYDKNYETKKEALEKAFNCLDLVAQNGVEIKNAPQYSQKAKDAYNALLCTLNSSKLYQEFYRLAVDRTTNGYSIEDIERFKIACRGELITRRRSKGEGFKGCAYGALNDGGFDMPTQPITQPQQPLPPQTVGVPQSPRTQQASRPVPSTPSQRPAQRPPNAN
ncbi:MAG: hypothetical protein J6Q15_01035 [Clostridia bacterium]|nr:hypothetical protein [Clostridia bacterium]